MSKKNPHHFAMKRAEYALKRSEFDPSEHTKEKYDWFRIEVGQSFEISNHKISSVRSMAHYRSNYSGYEFSVSKSDLGATVTRTA